MPTYYPPQGWKGKVTGGMPPQGIKIPIIIPPPPPPPPIVYFKLDYGRLDYDRLG